MWFSLSEHLLVTLYSFFLGIGLAVLYDLIRLTRIIFGVSSYSKTAIKLKELNLPLISKKNNKPAFGKAPSFLILLLSDILFFIICGAVYSLFFFHAVRGHIRWYFLLSSASGFLVYYFTLSKICIIFFEVLFFFIKCVIIYICMIVALPFKLIFRIILRGFQRFVRPILDNLRYAAALKYTNKLRDNLNTLLVIDDLINSR